MIRRPKCALVVLAAVLVAPWPSGAESGSDEAREEARRLYDAGAAAFEAGEHARALTLISESYERFESLRTLYSIGLCQFELGAYWAAHESLERYLREGGARAPRDLRRRAEALVRQMGQEGIPLTIEVSTPGATIQVDGLAAGRAPLEGPLSLAHGRHVVTAALAGHAEARQEVSLESGGDHHVTLELPLLDGRGAEPTTPVELRPIDRATVRLITVRGARAEWRMGGRSGQAREVFVPEVVHGSGVVVSEDGLVVTARHVVDGADVIAVLFAGETVAYPAQVANRDAERDLAVLRVSHRPPAIHPLPETPPRLVASERVSASGYPLDVTEQYPAATAGDVARALSDGRIQLSMSLNPGNSGGPVIDEEGHIVGIVSQRGDPTRGVAGVVMVEPVSAAIALVDRARGSGLAEPWETTLGEGELEAARLIASFLATDRSGLPGASAELESWGLLVAEPRPSPPVAALLAVLAHDLALALLEAHGALDAGSLPADVARQAEQLRAAAATLAAHALDADSSLSSRYQGLENLSSARRGGFCGDDGEACCEGTCTGELECMGGTCQRASGCESDEGCPAGHRCREGRCRGPRRSVHFRLGLAGGLIVDDHPRASFLGGGTGGLSGHLEVLHLGELAPVRFDLLVGAELDFGGWRGELAFAGLAEIGFRLALGTERVAAVITGLYGIGAVYAEKRLAFAYLDYRVMLGMELGRFGIALSWREASRDADTPLRAMELFVDVRL